MPHETLTTDPEAWGLTPTQYASREKARLRARERTRRDRQLAAFKARLMETPIEPVADSGPFMTPSGIMAYRKHVPNRVSLTSQPVNEGIATKAISLPYVSILADRTALQSKEGRG